MIFKLSLFVHRIFSIKPETHHPFLKNLGKRYCIFYCRFSLLLNKKFEGLRFIARVFYFPF